MKQVDRIKRFGLTCTLNDNGIERHFHHGHEYVEIGGIKWATMNVGADKVTDFGKYFQWGDTQGYTDDQVGKGQKYFGWEGYKYGNDAIMTKYNEIDGKAILESSDDAVTTAWGGSWRMPTKDEFEILSKAVNVAWTADYQGSGVSGLVCTDKKDSSKVLFFPACGYCSNGSVCNVDYYGFYWSISLHSSHVQNAYYLFFDNNKWVYCEDYGYRYFGFPVRGVVD